MNPLTKRIFNKQNIRQIVRQWLDERKSQDIGDKERFTKEIIEHNIEWFETLFMKAFKKFVTDTTSFTITTICYNNILNNKEDNLTEDYIVLLKESVKNLFLAEINTKKLTLNGDFESYICLKTVEDLFYKGEIYKKRTENFILIAQGGVPTKANESNFKKL